MPQHKKTALLLGASGLVGGHLLEQLLESEYYNEVVVFVRRPLDKQHPKLRQEIIDFDQLNPDHFKGDDLFSALGTTLRKAGSKEAQYKIDCTYPTETARLARAQNVKQCLLVSSLGADAKSSNFYLKTKGELEQNLVALGFDNFVSARPSLLLGNRAEFRLGEKIGTILANIFAPIIPKKYKGIQASTVATALISRANQNLKGVHFVESNKLDT